MVKNLTKDGLEEINNQIINLIELIDLINQRIQNSKNRLYLSLIKYS